MNRRIDTEKHRGVHHPRPGWFDSSGGEAPPTRTGETAEMRHPLRSDEPRRDAVERNENDRGIRQPDHLRGDNRRAPRPDDRRLPARAAPPKSGAGCGNRTRDLMITSQVLCQLS